MFNGFARQGLSATITSTNPIIGSHAGGGAGPAASASNIPANASPFVPSYGTGDYYALTPAANTMIGIPSQTGTVSTLAGTPITVTCAGSASRFSQTATPVVGAYLQMSYGGGSVGSYNGFPCLINTTSGNLLGAVATGDVSYHPLLVVRKLHRSTI